MYEINLQKFEQEAKILAGLDGQDGVVDVYDFFTENGTSYFVMKYLNGDSLKKYIKDNGKVSIQEAYKKLEPVMKSLSRIHDSGIIHRDISPDNILFENAEPNSKLDLIDFGGAKLQSKSALSEMTLKKVGYTPVEMYSVDGNQGPWTDVYAMAATFYYCITGKVPTESTARVVKDELKRPSEAGASVSKNVDKVIMKGLAIKAQDRYQTMAEFMTDLQKAMPHVDPVPKPRKKTAAIALIAAAVIGVGAGVGIHSMVKIRTPELDTASLPEKLDSNTVFTEVLPLTVSGDNLKYVDSVYLNGEKAEDLKVVSSSDQELQLAFSLPEDVDSVELSLGSHMLGIASTSEAGNIELYTSDETQPVMEAVYKGLNLIEGDWIRAREPFHVGTYGNGINENSRILVNGRFLDYKYKDDMLYGLVPQEIIDEVYPSGELSIQVVNETAEGYESSVKSEERIIKVNDWCITNSWMDGLSGENFEIVNLNSEIENSEIAVTNRVDELYSAGVRYFRYDSANGLDIAYVISALQNKEDTYLILNMTKSSDIQDIYTGILNACTNDLFYERLIAEVGSANTYDTWRNVNKKQNFLRIIFNAENADMTTFEMLQFVEKKGIQTISFGEESCWYNTSLRNKEEVIEKDLTFIYENPDNALEVYEMKNPASFGADEGTKGITAVISDAGFVEEYNAAVTEAQNIELIKQMGEGSSVKDYLNILADSGYTIMMTIMDDGQEVDNFANELDNLGVHSSVIKESFREAYVAVVQTKKSGTNELLFEQKKTTEEGARLYFIYSGAPNGDFTLESAGRTVDNQDISELTAAVTYEGLDLSLEQAGINIVVYDENNHCVIDTVSINTWDERNNSDPKITSKGSASLTMLKDVQRKSARKEKIVNYFSELADMPDNYIAMLAVSDDGSYNMGDEILSAMQGIGVTAPFGSDGFGKSYIGIFGSQADLLTDYFTTGENDTFADMKLSLESSDFNGHTIQISSCGSGLEDSSAHIIIDDEEMTNGVRGLHVLVYDLDTDKAVNYTWIDSYGNLKFDSVNLE